MTQAELAQAVGVSLRTMVSYENGKCYPKKRDVYGKLASELNLDENYLLTENERFSNATGENRSISGKHYAQQLITEISGFFSSGVISDEDLDAVMIAISKAYWIAKDKNRGYTLCYF
jgi:transcriptional regulator with XRE-family HTH domain